MTSAARDTPALECVGLRKAYSGEHGFALGKNGSGLSFAVGRGELFALVGPSGCGKTTTLQIVGGFVAPDAGRVVIDGRDVTDRPAYVRPTNTVFQGHALFPHMSVGGNVGFGLVMERVRRSERRRRVAEALELVGLGGYGARRVSDLSGGEQQRVALARAIVKRPAVLLLDEPLGALDLQLRKQLQGELVRLKASTQSTFVHVTHDQEEACAIADRIAVMHDGVILQVDEPVALFQRPRTTFVARFLDAGTIVSGRVVRQGNVITVMGDDIELRTSVPSDYPRTALAAVLPADKVRLGRIDGDSPNATGSITRIVFTGAGYSVHVRVGRRLELRAFVTSERYAALRTPIEVGTGVGLWWDPEDVVVVDDSDRA